MEKSSASLSWPFCISSSASVSVASRVAENSMSARCRRATTNMTPLLVLSLVLATVASSCELVTCEGQEGQQNSLQPKYDAYLVDPYTGEALDVAHLMQLDDLERLLLPAAMVASARHSSVDEKEKEAEEMSSSGLDKRATGQWNSLQGAWGKRARPSQWNSLQGTWGKRAQQWNSLQGAWGKRAPQWNSLNGHWGKRSQDAPTQEAAAQSVTLTQESGAGLPSPAALTLSGPINPWDKRLGSDFKRERPHWNKLRGMWGRKRSISDEELAQVAAADHHSSN